MDHDPNVPTEEEARALFYTVCLIGTFYAANAVRKTLKKRKREKELRKIHPNVETAQDMLNMKAIYEEWNV